MKSGSYFNTLVITVVPNQSDFTLNFNANGGSVSTTSKTVTYGSTYGDLPTPTRNGYYFIGWMTDSTSNFDYIYYANTYPDLYNAFGYDEIALKNHYLQHGINESESRFCNANQRRSINTYTYRNDSTLYAAWAQTGYTVNVSNTNTSSGSSSFAVTYGGSNTITVTPNSGYYLSSVSCPSGYICSGYTTVISATGQQTVTVQNNNTTNGGKLSFIGKMTGTGTYMQNMSASDCTTTARTVYDKRDDEPYLVQRLADGNCWMLDNLRLDLTNSTTRNVLTTSNTHADSTSLTSLKSGNRSAGARYASSGFAAWDSDSTSNVYNQAKANANHKYTVASTKYGNSSGKIGVYYNYCAASAGNYCYDGGSGTGNASYDICPYGWKMPTGGSSGRYQTLYTAYSSNATNFRNALSTPLSGNFNHGVMDLQGTSGYFWSSTYYDSSRMYDLYVLSNNLLPAGYNDRAIGFSVRCILGS